MLEGVTPARGGSDKARAFEPADFAGLEGRGCATGPCSGTSAFERKLGLGVCGRLWASVGAEVGAAWSSKQRPDFWTEVASAAVSSKKRLDSWTGVWFEAVSSKQRPDSLTEVWFEAVSSKQRPDSWTKMWFEALSSKFEAGFFDEDAIGGEGINKIDVYVH